METVNSLCNSDYCRLCAEENKNGTYLFSSEENSDDLSLVVNRYLPIKVEDDGKYPRRICPGCHIQLEATKLFMDLIVEGQLKLRDLYRKQQETSQKQEKQRQNLEEMLQTVNPKSTVETYTIQSDETGEKFFIQIFSEGPLFPPGHELPLRAEGLEKPKRKRGRPPKQILEPVSEENEPECKDEGTENVQHEEDNDVDADGRRRRRIRAPSRYQGIVEGKELDKFFKEEGMLDDEEIEIGETSIHNDTEEVIGRTETENGEDLGEPVFINRQKFRLKATCFSKKRYKKKYQCEVCKREFLHVGRYKLHKKSHRVKYVCLEPGCGVEDEDKALVDKHQSETGHSGVTAVEKIDSIGGTLQLPETAEVVKIDTLPTTAPSEPEYKCEECNKPFTCKQNLEVHNRAIHNQEKPFSCEVCDRSFSYANSLKLHMLKHDKEDRLNSAKGGSSKGYPCDICGKVLQHPSSLLYHRETEHSNGRRFVCNKCDKSFKHRQLLQRHQLVHSDERPFQCTKCDASFKTQANLINHEAVHTGEKKYICSQCGQKFAHRTSLTLHQRWHEGHKPYTCDVCHKAFSQKGNLAEHRRIHTGEKPYCCINCGKSFTTSSQFNLHRKRHTGERPWVCEYCLKGFLYKDTFKTHVRRHLNDRPFKCVICPRAFTEAWALKRHSRTHSGEKPYTCEQCGKTFADSSNKSKHMRTHNANNVKNIYRSSNLKQAYNGLPMYDGKDTSLLRILDPNMSETREKNDVEAPNLRLTQLVDQQGNPISITTHDGQTVPVVTGENDQNSIQGLLPDGTLVPIEITTVQEKDLIQAADVEGATLLNEEMQSSMNILKEDIMKDVQEDQQLSSNIQFLTGDDGQEVCLVTYSMDENTAINPELAINRFLIENIKK